MEAALDVEDYELADLVYARIRDKLNMTFPGGALIPEFLPHFTATGLRAGGGTTNRSTSQIADS